MHASLASKMFLKTYADKAYVERLTKNIEYPYLTQGIFKKTEQEAYWILLQITLPNFNVLHLRGYQDEDKQFEELDIPVKLNINADNLATTHS